MLRHSLAHSISPNTRAAYASSWCSFQAWCQAPRGSPPTGLAPLAAAYLSYLAQERRLSVVTIRLHKAALAAVHRAAGHDDPTDNEVVRRGLQGIPRAHGRPLTSEAAELTGCRGVPDGVDTPSPHPAATGPPVGWSNG